MRIYYGDEADYLEIRFGESRENYGEDLDKDITIFKDEKTDEIVGVGILNFKKRSYILKDILKKLNLNLPLNIGI